MSSRISQSVDHRHNHVSSSESVAFQSGLQPAGSVILSSCVQLLGSLVGGALAGCTFGIFKPGEVTVEKSDEEDDKKADDDVAVEAPVEDLPPDETQAPGKAPVKAHSRPGMAARPEGEPVIATRRQRLGLD